MENENNSTIDENNSTENESNSSNELENTNTTNVENNNYTENNTTSENTAAFTEQQDYNSQFQELHNDLGIISSFLIFFVIVVLLKYTYKFFNMFFVI